MQEPGSGESLFKISTAETKQTLILGARYPVRSPLVSASLGVFATIRTAEAIPRHSNDRPCLFVTSRKKRSARSMTADARRSTCPPTYESTHILSRSTALLRYSANIVVRCVKSESMISIESLMKAERRFEIRNCKDLACFFARKIVRPEDAQRRLAMPRVWITME